MKSPKQYSEADLLNLNKFLVSLNSYCIVNPQTNKQTVAAKTSKQ